MTEIAISDFDLTEDDLKSSDINTILHNLSRLEVVSAEDGRVLVITNAKYIVFSVQDNAKTLKIFTD